MDTNDLNDLSSSLDFLGVRQFRVTYPAEHAGPEDMQRTSGWIGDFRCVEMKWEHDSGVQEDWEHRFGASLPYVWIPVLVLLPAASCVLHVDEYQETGISRIFHPGCLYKHSVGIHVVEKFVTGVAENGPFFQVHFSFSPAVTIT